MKKFLALAIMLLTFSITNAQLSKALMQLNVEATISDWANSWTFDSYVSGSVVATEYGMCTYTSGNIWKKIGVNKESDKYKARYMKGYFYIKRIAAGKVKSEFVAIGYPDEYGEYIFKVCYKDNLESRCSDGGSAWQLFE